MKMKAPVLLVLLLPFYVGETLAESHSHQYCVIGAGPGGKGLSLPACVPCTFSRLSGLQVQL